MTATNRHTLYVAPGSAPCRAVLLTHKLLNDQPALDIEHVDVTKGEHKTEEFLKMNPRHCVPTLGMPTGKSMWESRAIMRHLVNVAGGSQLYPRSAFIRADIDRLLDWDQGVFYKKVGAAVYPRIFSGEDPTDDQIEAVVKEMEFLDHYQLGDGRKYLTGMAPTIADISIACGLLMLEFVDYPLEDHDNVAKWINQMGQCRGWDEVQDPLYQWRKSVLAA